MGTLYASFEDASMAEKATGALIDHGVRSEDISLVAHETYATRRGGTMYEGPVSAGVDPAHRDRVVADVEKVPVSDEYNTTIVERETNIAVTDRTTNDA